MPKDELAVPTPSEIFSSGVPQIGAAYCSHQSCIPPLIQCRVALLLRTPEIADYVHLPAARLLYQLEVLFILGWVVIVAAALYMRRRSPKNRALVLATCLHYVIGIGIFSYFFGSFTSLYSGVVAVAAWTFGLFAVRAQGWSCIAGITFLCMIGGTTLAEQLGWIPYGLYWISAPFESGRFRLVFTHDRIPSAILLLFLLALIDFILTTGSRHQRENCSDG